MEFTISAGVMAVDPSRSRPGVRLADMQLGLHFWNYSVPDQPHSLATTIADTAATAERIGFDQFTVMDHWFQMERVAPATEPMLEGYSTLAFVAGKTERMRLGTLVTGVTYRYPGLLAKTVTTLDVLSGGRAMLGIGAAWYDREHAALGVPYPGISERFERLEEALHITLQMWSDNDGFYQGVHYQLAETINSPQPIATPHPPIMIGGAGEKKTLRLAAQYAQIVNLTVSEPDEVAHKLEVLRGHCDTLGTDYDAIEKTVIMSSADPLADPDAFLRQTEALAATGVTLIVLGDHAAAPVDYLERFADELMEKVTAI
jgi:F420-dependent oxidoreductase-like protein